MTEVLSDLMKEREVREELDSQEECVITFCSASQVPASPVT